MQRDVEVDFDVAAHSQRSPDRSRVREVFREYELRDPLRRLEEALAKDELEPEIVAGELSRSPRGCGRARPQTSPASATHRAS